jgi:phage shock protein PspC (stress-responsive transcriptional regulator)
MTRNTNKAIVAGVAAGMAEDLNWPAWTIRAFYLITFFLFGLGFLLYVFAWLFSSTGNGGQMNLGMR